MVDVLADFAWTTVAVAPVPASSGLSLTVQAGEGSIFPQTGGFDCLMAPLGQPLLPNVELARASSVSGDVINFSSRGISPTTALSVQSGWQISQPIDAALLDQIVSIISGITDAGIARETLKVAALTEAACVSTSNVATLSGLNTYDGYTLAAGDIVLLTGQSTSSQDGPWVAASGAWTRPTEFATGDLVSGRIIDVINGTTYANTSWLLDAPTAGITIGTSSQTWHQVGGSSGGSGDTVTSPGGSTSTPGSTLAVGGTSTATTLNVIRRDQAFLSDYGIAGDFSTDNGANFATVANALVAANGGASLSLPHGTIKSSIPFVVPTITKLEGQGWFYYGTLLSLLSGANCDVVQMLKSPDGVQSNAFFCIIRDLMIDGNSGSQSGTDWHTGLLVVTNPWTGTASDDPNFDPQHLFERLWIQACSGDGVYCYSRGELVFNDIWAFNNRGTGIMPPFDSELVACKSQSNGLGGYMFSSPADTHLSSCHAYNNGTAPLFTSIFAAGAGTSWVISYQFGQGSGTFKITVPAGTTSAIAWNASAATVAAAVSAISGFTGTCTGSGGPLANPGSVTLTFSLSQASLTVAQTQTWNAGQMCVYSGAVYIATTTQTNYTGNNPLADTTNWTAPSRPAGEFSGARGSINRAPEWGYGYYIDGYGVAATISLAGCSALNNSAGAVYIHNASGNIIECTAMGNGNNPNNGAPIPTNPNNFGAFTVDGSNNNIIIGTVVGSSAAYGAVRIINGSIGNDIHITTDGVCAYFTADTTTAAIDANNVWINGVLQSGQNSSASATASAPTFVSGTALQFTAETNLYVEVTTANTVTIAMGPTSGASAVTPVAAVAAPIGAFYPIHVPKGWYVKITATIADLNINAVTC